MDIDFNGRIWTWRGHAPWYFDTVPAGHSLALQEIAGIVTCGWGTVPVDAQIGKTN